MKYWVLLHKRRFFKDTLKLSDSLGSKAEDDPKSADVDKYTEDLDINFGKIQKPLDLVGKIEAEAEVSKY